MNQPPVMPHGANPQAAGAAHAGPSQEDRLLAAASYVGYLTGFWLVVPIVIYVLKREKSRFIAFHAVQAVIVHALAIPVFLFGWIFAFGGAAIVALSLEGSRSSRADFHWLFMCVYLFGFLVPYGAYFLLSVLYAVRAMQGRAARFPGVSWLADRILAGDRSVAKD